MSFHSLELWPDDMLRLFKGHTKLSYSQRFRAVIFLYGNGMSPDRIYTLLRNRLRDQSAQCHVHNILISCQKSDMQHKLFYFDIGAQDTLTLHGKEYGTASGSRIYTRKVNSWNNYTNVCATYSNRYPSLDDQHRYMRSESIDAFSFFNLV